MVPDFIWHIAFILSENHILISEQTSPINTVWFSFLISERSACYLFSCRRNDDHIIQSELMGYKIKVTL